MRHSSERGRLPFATAFFAFIVAFLVFPPRAVVIVEAQGPPVSPLGQADSIELDGELEVQIEDSPTGSRVHHFLKVGTTQLRLRFTGPGPELLSGTRVRARGRLQNNELALASDGSMQTLALASPNTFGQQRVAVILVNFQNLMSTPYTASTAQSVTFGQVNQFYLDNSYEQTSIAGQVFGWYTLPINVPSICDYDMIATKADQAAAANGVNLSQFARKVYAFPQIAVCGWWGLGTVGGNPSRSWINGSYALKVVGHELGHNFGLYHSNSMPCSTGGCSASEYGDDRDMMGMSSVGHFNGFQKERVGWLNYGSSPSIQSITSSGTYWIEAYGTAPSGGPKALRILKSTDGGGSRTWYYVESRARLGFDNGFDAGVTIHTGSEATGNSSYQVDLAPSTTTFDSLLDAGQVFTDAAIDLAIRTVSASDAGAFVEISYPGVPCTTTAPTVALSPANTTGQLGQPAPLTLTIRNNDSTSSCSAVTFVLNTTVPPSWNATYTPTVVVAPGSTVTSPVSVTPMTSGTGQVNSLIARQGSSGPGGSASAAVNVVSSLTVVMSVVKSNGYQISATVSAGTSPVAGVPVSFSVRDPAGKISSYSAPTNTSGVARITVRTKGKDPRGTYTVSATATSGSLTGTSSTTFVY